MKKTFFLLLVWAVMVSACAPAEPEPVLVQSGMEIYMPQVAAARAGEVGAVFLAVRNLSGQDDRLLAAVSDAAGETQIHETVITDGVMSMQEVQGIDIPNKGNIKLMHGSYHIMLIGLQHDLAAGTTIRLTLTFEKAGEISFDVPVVEP